MQQCFKRSRVSGSSLRHRSCFILYKPGNCAQYDAMTVITWKWSVDAALGADGKESHKKLLHEATVVNMLIGTSHVGVIVVSTSQVCRLTCVSWWVEHTGTFSTAGRPSVLPLVLSVYTDYYFVNHAVIGRFTKNIWCCSRSGGVAEKRITKPTSSNLIDYFNFLLRKRKMHKEVFVETLTCNKKLNKVG